MKTIRRRTKRVPFYATIASIFLLATALARPTWAQNQCFSTNPGECKNQWLVNAYGRTCEATTSACQDVTQFLSDLCTSACSFGQQAWDTLCGVTYDACSAAHNTCENLANGAYQTCLTTGLGTGCNAEHVACLGGCTAAALLLSGHGECWWAFSDACNQAKANCRSACDSDYGQCKRDRCDAMWGGAGQLCGECNDCQGTLDLECAACTQLAEANCLATTCGPAADALCIDEKQLGDPCVWGQCARGLRCLPDLTGLEDLDPVDIVAALLGSTSPQDAINALLGAGSDATRHNVQFADLFCTDLSKGCHCSLPLLENVGKEIDTTACLAFYRPGRHFMSYLLNKDIGTMRDFLIDQWRNAPGGISPERAQLIDDFENSGRLQTVALAYGVGGQAAAVAGGTAEAGTLYGPRCYGCYYTLCGSAVTDLTVNAYGTVAVYDAGGGDIDNLEGLSRVVSLAGSTPGIEIGGALGLVFPIPLQVQLDFDDIGGNAWKQQVQDWGDQVQNLVSSPEDVLEWFIPSGATGAVSVGVGVLPANGTGSLCYTIVRKTLCLREDDGGASCPTIDVDQATIDPPVAACQDQSVVAAAWPGCQASASIDAGSTGYDTLTQVPPGPYDIGARTVTLTAYNDNGALSSCTADVTVTDVTPPQITCPADPQPVECQADGHATFDPGDAVVHDCTAVTVTDTRLASYPLGQTSVSYQAKDAADNWSAPCSTTVTVVDTTDPSITCPESLTGRCAIERSFTVTASDACDPSPSVSCADPTGQPIDPAGHAFPVGDTTVRCTATDGSGNTGQCTFVATITDSLICAINRLMATVRAEPDLDPFEERLLRQLEAAAALADRVDELIAEGRPHKAARLLRAISGRLRGFGRILRSQRARRSIPEPLRQALIAEQLSIRDQARALREELWT